MIIMTKSILEQTHFFLNLVNKQKVSFLNPLLVISSFYSSVVEHLTCNQKVTSSILVRS